MILVDANIWVASHDTADVAHAESLRFLRRVLRDGWRCMPRLYCWRRWGAPWRDAAAANQSDAQSW